MNFLKKISFLGNRSRRPDNQFDVIKHAALQYLDNKNSKLSEMVKAGQYYKGVHDIKDKKRLAIGEDGLLVEVTNLPNNRILDNVFATLVDQKTNYLLGKPLVVETKDEKIKKFFSRNFHRKLRRVGQDAITAGIGWLYVYVNEDGEIETQRFRPQEIIPFWADQDHTELDAVARVYQSSYFENGTEREETKLSIYTKEEVRHYKLQDRRFVKDPDQEDAPHIVIVSDVDEKYSFGRVPFVPFKSNSSEISLLSRVKSLQDAINMIMSNFADNMQEDKRNTIMVLKNFDGEDLGEFRHQMSVYGAVKVRTEEGVAGDVDSLHIDVNSDNYKEILTIFRKALVTNGRGYDAKDDRMGNNPNQLNIRSMFSEIDLDATMMETEFQAALEELINFVHWKNGINEEFSFVFDRDTLINESTVIDDIRKSVGILSEETLIAQHPYTKDAAEELNRVRAERAITLTENNQFPGSGEGNESE